MKNNYLLIHGNFRRLEDKLEEIGDLNLDRLVFGPFYADAFFFRADKISKQEDTEGKLIRINLSYIEEKSNNIINQEINNSRCLDEKNGYITYYSFYDFNSKKSIFTVGNAIVLEKIPNKLFLSYDDQIPIGFTQDTIYIYHNCVVKQFTPKSCGPINPIKNVCRLSSKEGNKRWDCILYTRKNIPGISCFEFKDDDRNITNYCDLSLPVHQPIWFIYGNGGEVAYITAPEYVYKLTLEITKDSFTFHYDELKFDFSELLNDDYSSVSIIDVKFGSDRDYFLSNTGELFSMQDDEIIFETYPVKKVFTGLHHTLIQYSDTKYKAHYNPLGNLIIRPQEEDDTNKILDAIEKSLINEQQINDEDEYE